MPCNATLIMTLTDPTLYALSKTPDRGKGQLTLTAECHIRYHPQKRPVFQKIHPFSFKRYSIVKEQNVTLTSQPGKRGF
jgi:hypothetical protein